jgi:carbon monoxide dehydrogenase subunit G
MSWHALEPADESFFSTAPHRYRFEIDLDVPPERVWESLQSDESLAAWGPAVRSVRWTSPRPFGVGTTREVALPLGTITVRERFFVWDEGKRYSFYVVEANRPMLKRFAEDYVVEPRPGGSRLTWTVAQEAQPKYRRLVAAGSPVTKLAFGRMASSAKPYFAKHPQA